MATFTRPLEWISVEQFKDRIAEQVEACRDACTKYRNLLSYDCGCYSAIFKNHLLFPKAIAVKF